MKLIEQPGGRVYVAEAPVWDRASSTLEGRDHLLVGVTPAAIGLKANRGMRAHLGQLYGIVCPGLIMTKYLYQGLKRGMHVGDNASAARTKIAASWTSTRDAYLGGPPEDPRLEYSPAPENRVFVVYISPNEMLVVEP